MPRRPAPLLLLLLFAFSARAEFPVTETRPLAPTLGGASDAQVVATDSGFLAFWSTNPSYGGPAGLAQVGRFSRDGVLERRATAWDLPPSFVWHDAASNGDQVLLAGMCAPGYTNPLCLARFSAEGDFLDLITLPIRGPIDPVVASNGEGFLVVFGTQSPAETLAIPVSAEGTVGTTILLSSKRSSSPSNSVTAIGETYFVTYGSDGRNYLARVAGTGTDRSIPLAGASGYAEIEVESSGDRLLVVAAPGGAHFAIFDAELTTIVDWSPLDGGVTYPTIAPTSSGWIVTLDSNAGITTQPVTRAGRPGPARPSEKAFGYTLDSAGTGDRAAIVWTRSDTEPVPAGQVRMAILDGGGDLLHGPATISLGPAPQIHPAAAHGNGVLLTAWSERSADGSFVVRTRPFDAAGSPLAPPLSMPFRGRSQLRPAVASDGESFFIVWTEGTPGDDGIYGTRIASDGRILDPMPIPLFGPAPRWHPKQRAADVSWSGTAWIVASSDERWRVVAKRVTPWGSVPDAKPLAISLPVSGENGADYAPVIECNGAECLVAWHGPPLPDACRITCPSGPTPSVRVSRIGSSLTLLDAVPWLLTTVWEPVTGLDVSWNALAEAWLVSWSVNGQKRIARNGFPAGPEASPSIFATGSISAIPEREGWRLVWSNDDQGDLFHGWSATGDVSSITRRFRLTETVQREWHPRLVAAPRPLALFQRESPIDAGSPAVIARFLDESTGDVTPDIALTAERLGGGKVRLTWSTALPNVTGFAVQAFDGGWRHLADVGPAIRTLEIAAGAATGFRVLAKTPGETIVSAIVEPSGARRRAVDK